MPLICVSQTATDAGDFSLQKVSEREKHLAIPHHSSAPHATDRSASFSLAIQSVTHMFLE